MSLIFNQETSTKGKIIKSGFKHFLKEGYEKSNLRDICKTAGVTTGAFYKIFSSKEELFDELVGSLAEKILNLYRNYEDKSFDIYNSDGDLNEEKIQEVLDIKEEASVESVSFFYDNKFTFQLLIFSSYGTKYENFIDRIIEFEDENQEKILKMIYGDEYTKVITNDSIHLIDHAYIYALAELVVHAESKEDVVNNARIIAKFFSDGWKKIRGL